MTSVIPIGWHFRPTEEELIALLYLKITNQPQATEFVKEKTLYGGDYAPWNLLSDGDIQWYVCDENGNKTTKRMAFLFTKLTKLSAKKVARTAGSGSWQVETKSSPVPDPITGDIIGSKKMFGYLLNSGAEEKKKMGGWIMHEYSLDGASLNGIDSSIHEVDYVVCRIIIDDSKYTKNKRRKGQEKTELGKRKLINPERGNLLEAEEAGRMNKKANTGLDYDVVQFASDLDDGLLQEEEDGLVETEAGYETNNNVETEAGEMGENAIVELEGDDMVQFDANGILQQQFTALLDGSLQEEDGFVEPEVAFPDQYNAVVELEGDNMVQFDANGILQQQFSALLHGILQEEHGFMEPEVAFQDQYQQGTGLFDMLSYVC